MAGRPRPRRARRRRSRRACRCRRSSGSRSPSRFRFGPESSRIVAIVLLLLVDSDRRERVPQRVLGRIVDPLDAVRARAART